MTLATIPWAVWIIYFAIVEGRAIARRRVQDTFSWQVWTAERRWPLLRAVAGLVTIWLFEHFVFGWF